jgi:phosphopantetheinyl transferase
MAHPHHHLAAGAAPVVGRMFEAAMYDDAATPGLASAPASAPSSVTASALAGGESAHRLPFVADILACRPGASITVARRLVLERDLFLADHNFVAPEVKPLADCFPVLPMTVSLEVMAETAACLAPGYGLVGIEGVIARRWIAVTDGGALDLRIEGRVVHQAPAGDHDGCARITVQVYAGSEATAAIEATLLFATHYDAAPPAFDARTAGAAPDAVTLDGSAVYATRQLFHGPRFQGLDGPIRLGPEGASATMLLRPAHDWFAGQPCPQLLCDPALLDTVGQLIGVWCMQHGGTTFPIGLDRIDFHGPTPAPGTRVPVVFHVASRQLKMFGADVNIGDGVGGTWMRIRGWKSWEFQWPAQLVAFQRRPGQVLLSTAQALPGAGAGGGAVCQRVTEAQIAGFDLALLARHYLHTTEMAQFLAKKALPKRQLEWLLGRIAAKDAARAWRAAQHGGPQLHPAAFAIINDARGQPHLAAWPDALPVPFISIAHCAGQAVALAAAGPVGIDIEQVVAHDDGFLAAFSSTAERRLLAGCAHPEHDTWVTRLWCAKEAMGKRMGSGVDGAPQDFEAHALCADGSLQLLHWPSGVAACIATLCDGDMMLAVDLSAM